MTTWYKPSEVGEAGWDGEVPNWEVPNWNFQKAPYAENWDI